MIEFDALSDNEVITVDIDVARVVMAGDFFGENIYPNKYTDWLNVADD